MKKVRTISIVLGSLLLLVLVCLLISQTALFNRWLRSKLLAYTEAALNGEFAIGTLRSSLFGADIDSVRWTIDSELFVAVERATIRINPFSLLSKKVAVQQFLLVGPSVRLIQEGESWNVSRWVRPSPSSGSDSNWRVEIEDLHVISGSIDVVSAVRGPLPERVKNIEAEMALSFAETDFRLSLKKLSFLTEEPTLNFRNIESTARIGPGRQELSGVTLETDSTKLKADLAVNDPGANRTIDFQLDAAPLSFSDIRGFFPSLKFFGSPLVDFQAKGPLRELELDCDVGLGASELTVAGKLQVEDPPFGYDLNGSISNLNLGALTERDLPESDFNLEFELRGRGVEWGKIDAVYTIKFGSGFVEDRTFEAASLSGSIAGDSLSFSSTVLTEDGSLGAVGLILAGDPNLHYQMSGEVRDLNLAQFATTRLRSTGVNFDFLLTGTGQTWTSADANLLLVGRPSKIDIVDLDSARVVVSAKNETVTFEELRLHSPDFELKAVGEFANQTQFDLKATVLIKDLARSSALITPDSLQGRGRVLAHVTGTLDSVALTGNFDLAALVFREYAAGELSGSFGGTWNGRANSLAIDGRALSLSVPGLDSLNSSFEIDFADSTGNFGLAVERKSKPVIASRGRGRVPESGGLMFHFNELILGGLEQQWSLKSENNELYLDESGLAVGNFALASGDQSLELSGRITTADTCHLELKAKGFNLSAMSAYFEEAGDLDGLVNLEVTLQDSLNEPRITGRIEITEPRYKHLKPQHLAARFDYGGRELDFEAFAAAFGNDSLLSIRGRLPIRLSLAPFELQPGNEGLEVATRLGGLQVSDATTLLGAQPNNGRPSDFEGGLELRANLRGTLEKPLLACAFEVSQGRYAKVPFERFSGSITFDGEIVRWNCGLFKTTKDSLMRFTGFLPSHVSLIPPSVAFLRDESAELKLSTDGLDLSFLQALTQNVLDLKGTLTADVVLSNTIDDLRGIGPIRLSNGAFRVPDLGTTYRDVNAALTLKGSELLVRDFSMRSGNGELTISNGSLSLTKAQLDSFNSRVKAKNFQLMNTKKLKANVDGEVNLSGSLQAPLFSGQLKVVQADVFYPAWLDDDEQRWFSETPFFVVDDSVSFRSASQSARLFSRPNQLFETELYKQLRGELTVRAPKNSWIRSDETNIEITGELQLVKAGSDFELFGTVSTLRGFYELFGRRFQITAGTLTFAGGTDYNPDLRIEAVHRYYLVEETRKRHELKVFITGTKLTPQFRFSLDGQEAEQRDVMGILLFGKNFDDLSVGQRNSISEFADLEKKATGFLADQLIQRLSRTVGRRLTLDVLHFESDKGASDARLNIGKYVTPDVFVTLSQDFGGEGNQRVELEYNLPRILFFNTLLQASRERKGPTGLDLFWKIAW